MLRQDTRNLQVDQNSGFGPNGIATDGTDYAYEMQPV